MKILNNIFCLVFGSILFVQATTITNTVFTKEIDEQTHLRVEAWRSAFQPRPEQLKEMHEFNETHQEMGKKMELPDMEHVFQFVLETNLTPQKFVVWQEVHYSTPSYEDRPFGRDVYQVLDVLFDRTNLIVLARIPGTFDMCDVINLSSKKSLTFSQAKLLDGKHTADNLPELRNLSHLPGPSHIRKTSDGFYEVVSEWARDLGKTAYDPTRQIMRRISNWETNHVVFRFNGQNWDLLTTNLWAKPKPTEE
jgi:hypothetical protein